MQQPHTLSAFFCIFCAHIYLQYTYIYIALIVLELAIQIGLASNSEIPLPLPPECWTEGMHHCALQLCIHI